MSGKQTLPCTQDQYENIIDLLFNGVGTAILPNPKIATALEIEANTGLRIGDVLKLRMSEIVKSGNGYRFNLIEQKTKKRRTFVVPDPVYKFLSDYCKKNGIEKHDIIFPITVRGVQKHLQKVCDYLGYEDISTHSFRKKFACSAYANSGHDVELVRVLLQHSSVSTTSRYLGITNDRITGVMNQCVSLV